MVLRFLQLLFVRYFYAGSGRVRSACMPLPNTLAQARLLLLALRVRIDELPRRMFSSSRVSLSQHLSFGVKLLGVRESGHILSPYFWIGIILPKPQTQVVCASGAFLPRFGVDEDYGENPLSFRRLSRGSSSPSASPLIVS